MRRNAGPSCLAVAVPQHYRVIGKRRQEKIYMRGISVRDKTSRRNYGLLQPLDIPHQPRKPLAMDFAMGLPEPNGFTQICVFVDWLTKMAHSIPAETGDKPSA